MHPLSSPSYILVKGTYTNDNNVAMPNRYYKVDFTFTMSQLPSQGYVTVALENLEPYNDKNNANNPENETRLTFIEVVDGKALYSFNPTSNTETLHLMTASAGVPAVSVTFSAYHFEDVSASLFGRIYIPAGNIQGLTGNYTYYLYSKDPGRTQNPGNTIGGTNNNNKDNGIISVSDGVNSADIDLTSELYKTIMEGDGNVYVRYTTTTSTGWWQTTNYYIATVLLSDLMDEDGATLNFIKQ